MERMKSIGLTLWTILLFILLSSVIFTIAIVDYPNKDNSPLLDILNRWQILLTAIVALIGATLAYRAATAKVRSDEKINLVNRRSTSIKYLDKFRDYSMVAHTCSEQFLEDTAKPVTYEDMFVKYNIWKQHVPKYEVAEEAFEAAIHEYTNEEMVDVRLFLYSWRSVVSTLYSYKKYDPPEKHLDIEMDAQDLMNYCKGLVGSAPLIWHITSNSIEKYADYPISASRAKHIESGTKELRAEAVKAHSLESMRRLPD